MKHQYSICIITIHIVCAKFVIQLQFDDFNEDNLFEAKFDTTTQLEGMETQETMEATQQNVERMWEDKTEVEITPQVNVEDNTEFDAVRAHTLSAIKKEKCDAQEILMNIH